MNRSYFAAHGLLDADEPPGGVPGASQPDRCSPGWAPSATISGGYTAGARDLAPVLVFETEKARDAARELLAAVGKPSDDDAIALDRLIAAAGRARLAEVNAAQNVPYAIDVQGPQEEVRVAREAILVRQRVDRERIARARKVLLEARGVALDLAGKASRELDQVLVELGSDR